MPARRAKPNVSAARLTVLAASDRAAFRAQVVAMLGSGERLAREAALEALIEQPYPGARDALRTLYFELDADGPKRDQGARMRSTIVRVLRAVGDVRDADLAIAASAAREIAFGEDIAWQLRANGLMLLADVAPESFPYYAIEHLDDIAGDSGEPANTAFQLLAGSGQYAPVYQWLLGAADNAPLIASVFELFAAGPPAIVERYVVHAVERALRRGDEALLTVLVEAIVRLELERAYSALADVIAAKVSEELYNYLAVVLAGTNRAPLLAILEGQLHRGRHPKLIAAALRVRPTPEQDAILRRWEEGE